MNLGRYRKILRIILEQYLSGGESTKGGWGVPISRRPESGEAGVLSGELYKEVIL